MEKICLRFCINFQKLFIDIKLNKSISKESGFLGLSYSFNFTGQSLVCQCLMPRKSVTDLRWCECVITLELWYCYCISFITKNFIIQSLTP